jgi:predicted metal-binding protein
VTFSDTACDPNAEEPIAASITIFVCITCRRSGDPEDSPRPGASLAVATMRAAQGTAITVRRVRCLANCNRGLSAALKREGGWSYVFGDLHAETDGAALVQGARLFARSSDGLMPWRDRPAPLKRGLIARVPPTDHEDAE